MCQKLFNAFSIRRSLSSDKDRFDKNEAKVEDAQSAEGKKEIVTIRVEEAPTAEKTRPPPVRDAKTIDHMVEGYINRTRLDVVHVGLQIFVMGDDIPHRLPRDHGRHPLPPVRGPAVDVGQRVLEDLVLLLRPAPASLLAQDPVRAREVGRSGWGENLHT
ncbi:uncharacterized protein A4U43_C02F17320 [Asparagus officinalis]|uniref:Uncharacterized protein n=1 Tax=Asparagus officinalis TaxID=4686 RepID=A0A5P1FJR1_ASPOF|nr:uncharacterized protein A4U43_C02F17320 [Asparagus officinalis]